MAQRQMHLVAFLMTGPTCHHHGAWRHQETDIADISRSRHEPIARVLEAGSRGSFDVILQGTEAEGPTFGEAARRFAIGELCPRMVGAPELIADNLTDLFDDFACDGFVLTPTTFSGMPEQFCKTAVPLLQKRGAFRTRYMGATLREQLHG
jgi:alkanesulfonate monooxygenase SsuD/methylene tetrahydromethanopterin reductase-like flavin-dependent oxidoreductase (luciferase family)